MTVEEFDEVFEFAKKLFPNYKAEWDNTQLTLINMPLWFLNVCCFIDNKVQLISREDFSDFKDLYVIMPHHFKLIRHHILPAEGFSYTLKNCLTFNKPEDCKKHLVNLLHSYKECLVELKMNNIEKDFQA